jgi:hypothetical protein
VGKTVLRMLCVRFSCLPFLAAFFLLVPGVCGAANRYVSTGTNKLFIKAFYSEDSILSYRIPHGVLGPSFLASHYSYSTRINTVCS